MVAFSTISLVVPELRSEVEVCKCIEVGEYIKVGECLEVGEYIEVGDFLAVWINGCADSR